VSTNGKQWAGIEQSRQLLAKSDTMLIRGCQGHKRNHMMLERGYPVFTARAEGACFWDVDGNKYLDYLMGFGPIVLGHAHPAVNEALAKQMRDGTIFTTAHPKELEVAEKALSLLPGDQMLGFFIGGSAATSGALRLARAYTERDKVIRCGYHGWHDWTHPGTPGVPQAVADLVLEFPYGDLNALEDLLKQHGDDVACVIVETVQGAGAPEGFLQACVDLAHKHGALCVFDEIKAAFRVALGGGGELYNVQPDMSTYGKACCNGFPGSFVTGRREILSKPACQEAWLAATFHCDLPSLTALEVVIDEMQRHDGIAHQHRLSGMLCEGINAACAAAGLSYRLIGPGGMPQPVIDPEDKPLVIKMLVAALKRGHYLHPGHVMFLSLAHTEEDVKQTIQAVREACAEVTADAPAKA
jgi:glutamate-1-semialdehyde aminotransferase